jgi:hypothetical protein
MGKANALYRREDHSIGIEKDNTGVLVIPPDQIVLQKFILQQMLTSSSTQSRISFSILRNQI